MPSTFLIPSLLWYGLTPPVGAITPAVGADPLAVGGWGGRLTNDESVATLARTLDSALLLLNLAGYQALEIAVGVPAAAQETPGGDLIALDTATMTYTRGTQRAWAPFGGTPQSAQVALWIEPRYPVGPLVHEGPTLSLVALGDLGLAGIELEFAPTGSGWLRFTWPATLGDWPFQLTARVDRLRDELSAELARQAGIAGAPGNGVAPLCGLIGLYNPSTWRVPLPDPGQPISAPVARLGALLEQVLNAMPLGEFFPGETAPPPEYPTTLGERLVAGKTDDEAAANLEDLEEFGSELVVQIPELLLPLPRYLSFAESARLWFGDLSVTQVLFYGQELGVLDFLTTIGEQVAAGFPAVARYGAYDLRRGDNDTGHVYDGHARPLALGDPVPGAGDRGYVAQLRRDLAELGFGPMFDYGATERPNQAFDLHLEWAVRELQLYARMPNLARLAAGGNPVFYADFLEQVPNPSPYAGPVCGVVNEETRVLIGQWLDGFLRCPVVIEARATPDYAAPPGAGRTPDNLWLADQIANQPDPGVRVFARDFTGHWPLLPASGDAGRGPGDHHVLGAWIDTDFGPGPWSTPPDHTWPESEFLPETLAGAAIADLGAAARSTFRVVRAVSEVEANGYFDCFNAYDFGYISTGPFHWTIGRRTRANPDSLDGELPPFLAYLQGLGGAAAEAAHQAFGVFGCGVTKEWPAGTSGPGSPCWFDEHRKYLAWITLEDEHGTPVEAVRAGGEAGEWFRQWHWFFRFSMTARTNETLRLGMWEYARLRVRDLLSTPWNPPLPMAGAGGAPATIGDLFTSERAVAFLLRWHVNNPPQLMPLRPASPIVQAYAAAQAAGAPGVANWADPSVWNDANEAAMCDGLLAQLPPPGWLRTSLERVYEWPSWWLARNPYAFSLPVGDLLSAPVINGLVNGQVAVGASHQAPFTIAWLGPPGFLTATSSNHAVVRDSGIAFGGLAPNHTITVTPRPGQAGRTAITVIADNNDGRTEATFTLTVGAVAGAPPVPTSSSGLSKRRGSFRLDEAGLP